MSHNNRSTHRFVARLEVDYRIDERSVRAHTRNLSLGGLFLDDTDLPIGHKMVIRVRLPVQKEPIEIGVIVRWHDGAGIGVQFDGLRAKDVWALGKYFESL